MTRPQPYRRANSILTATRKRIIMKYKGIGQGHRNIGTNSWINGLASYFFLYDAEVSLDDIHRWIRNHPWITIESGVPPDWDRIAPLGSSRLKSPVVRVSNILHRSQYKTSTPINTIKDNIVERTSTPCSVAQNHPMIWKKTTQPITCRPAPAVAGPSNTRRASATANRRLSVHSPQPRAIVRSPLWSPVASSSCTTNQILSPTPGPSSCPSMGAPNQVTDGNPTSHQIYDNNGESDHNMNDVSVYLIPRAEEPAQDEVNMTNDEAGSVQSVSVIPETTDDNLGNIRSSEGGYTIDENGCLYQHHDWQANCIDLSQRGVVNGVSEPFTSTMDEQRQPGTSSTKAFSQLFKTFPWLSGISGEDQTVQQDFPGLPGQRRQGVSVFWDSSQERPPLPPSPSNNEASEDSDSESEVFLLGVETKEDRAARRRKEREERKRKDRLEALSMLGRHRLEKVQGCTCVHCRTSPPQIPANLLYSLNREVRALCHNPDQLTNSNYYHLIILAMELLSRHFAGMDELRAALLPMEVIRSVVFRNYKKITSVDHAVALSWRYKDPDIVKNENQTLNTTSDSE